jgi:2-oxoisovalerate ferredoxin oxidoreductase beta subunit
MTKEIQRFGKAESFYDTYERKGEGSCTTHYCPGCGHGTIQKMIAEAIDALGIQDRTVFLSPVGCAVFAYYYYDTGNIQCSHGRAPAVATGVKRTVKDAIVISYQGDGDLAGIGMTEIMHAANRGEPITVFFINNAIYGMTGGQMAPTTPLGQKTLTTPFGRDEKRDGNPLGMAEVMNALKAPIYIERCAVSSPKQIIKTKKAIRKALQAQVDGLGFSFVEILSPCPTNWRMTPVDSRAWIDQQMVEQFPLGTFRDIDKEGERTPPSEEIQPLDDLALIEFLTSDSNIPILREDPLKEIQRIKIAGFGGQGVLSAGELLATCGMMEHLEVSWLPSYGPEMRGGSANVSVTLSKDEIGSPLIDHPNVLIVMNSPSLDMFEPLVSPGGLVVVNSSIVDRKVERSDVQAIYIPATEIARDAGLQSAANVVLATTYLSLSGVIPLQTLKTCIPLVLRKREYLEKNLKIVEKTLDYLENTN